MKKHTFNNGGIRFWILILVIVAVAVVAAASKLFRTGEQPIGASSAQTLEQTSKNRAAISKQIAAQEYGEVFKSDKYKFSLSYPEGLTVTNFSDGNGETFLFQDSSAKVGFQIYVSPLEDTSVKTITKELILKDIPDMVISEDQPVLIGEGGIGVAFVETSGGEKRRQVWFSMAGNLYQITAPIESDGLLQKVLNGWGFY